MLLSYNRMTVAVFVAGLLLPDVAEAADAQFYSTLEPAPITMATRGNVLGSGSVTAELNGNMLTVQGNFVDLALAPTEAHLDMGAMTGVPGDLFANLTVTQAQRGTFSRTVAHDRKQLMALRAGIASLGDYDCEFKAVDVKTGKILWKVQFGKTVQGHPISFRIDGKQYTAITTGYAAGAQKPSPPRC